jgi:pyrroline-5-carboxylate reductase
MQINILGFGNMGRAIARALIKNNFKGRIVATDRARKAGVDRGVKLDAGFRTLSRADVIVVAVKPQDILGLADEVRHWISKDAILVSVAAGVKISKLQKVFGHKKVVRVMPNLGVLVGRGIMAWKPGGLSSADKNRARKLLNSVSDNFEVADEKLIDAVTAISGSGPAYFFFLANGLVSSAKQLGLSPAQSRVLVQKTLSAAARLQEGRDYQELIKMILSKKGATDAALKVFAKHRLGNTINAAVKAAYKRAGELSK